MIAAHKRAGLSCGGAAQTTAHPVNGASQTAGSSHAKSLYSQSVLSPNEDSPKYFTKMTFASSSPLTPARQCGLPHLRRDSCRSHLVLRSELRIISAHHRASHICGEKGMQCPKASRMLATAQQPRPFPFPAGVNQVVVISPPARNAACHPGRTRRVRVAKLPRCEEIVWSQKFWSPEVTFQPT